jgi:hypothetical protein
MHNQLAEEAEFEGKSVCVRALFETLISRIKHRRTSTICRMAVDADRINEIAKYVEISLMHMDDSLELFGSWTIARAGNCVSPPTLVSVPVSKGYLVTPLMHDPPANFHEWIAEHVRREAASEVWRALRQRAELREAGSPV